MSGVRFNMYLHTPEAWSTDALSHVLKFNFYFKSRGSKDWTQDHLVIKDIGKNPSPILDR